MSRLMQKDEHKLVVRVVAIQICVKESEGQGLLYVIEIEWDGSVNKECYGVLKAHRMLQ